MPLGRGNQGQQLELSDRQLLDFIEHPVFVLEPDGQGRVIYAAMNRFARAVGDWSEEDVLGRTALQLYPGSMGEAAYIHHGNVFTSGAKRSYELLLKLGGIQRLIRTTLVPVTGDDGSVIRVVGTSTELSGQQSFGASDPAANQSEAEDFIRLAAHDLRAPLRQISMIADMMRHDFQDLGDGKIQMIDMLEQVGEKSLRLIGDILALAQIPADHGTPMIEFELSGVIDELMTILDPLRRCRVECGTVLVRGERTVVQTILRNLIDNAIKHAGQTHALSLRFRAVASGGDMVSFYVQDDGGGFDDPAVLFLQGGGIRSESGFGLLAVRRLVHGRGGTIGACNLPGGVAEISFSLPGSVLDLGTGSRPRQVVSRILSDGVTPGSCG